MSLEDSCFQVIPNHFFEKGIRLQRAQEGDSGSISFAAFRLYEPKSREGVLGPDLRVLILLEYPGVSPRRFPDEGPMVKVGAGREACLGRVITAIAATGPGTFTTGRPCRLQAQATAH